MTNTSKKHQAAGGNAAMGRKKTARKGNQAEHLAPKDRDAVKKGRPVPDEIRELTAVEATQLSTHETIIKDGLKSNGEGFQKLALAFHAIMEGKLYLGSHGSFEAYFIDRWHIGRAHAYRFADAGKIIKRVSPSGDTIKALVSESHFRYLTGLTEDLQDAVIAKIGKWIEITGNKNVTPKVVEAAVLIVKHAGRDDEQPRQDGANGKRLLLQNCVENIKAKLEPKVVTELKPEFDALAQAIEPPRLTEIIWAEATWNTVHGCSPTSPGCDYCYAAKLCATRLVHKRPGIAGSCKRGDFKSFAFNGTIVMDVEHMAEPLKDRFPKRYFVNSQSDLFHPNVPEAFIDEAFEVMEKASRHTFEVLTKRTKRMAEYLAKRYGKDQVPSHIWIGTTVEDQARLDERLPLLLEINAAVRWLSVEPLLGALKLPSLDGIHWVVVGGESGSTRKMEKAWVTSIRDQCKKAKVAFFFKQWGEYGEDGIKLKGKQGDATLDGVVHHNYPEPLPEAVDATDNPKKPKGDKGTAENSAVPAQEESAA